MRKINTNSMAYEVGELVDVVRPDNGAYLFTAEVRCLEAARPQQRTWYRLILDNGSVVRYPAAWIRGADESRKCHSFTRGHHYTIRNVDTFVVS